MNNKNVKQEISFTEPRYELNTHARYWREADEYCRDQGGHLASVTTIQELQRILDVAEDNSVWLGGTDQLCQAGIDTSTLNGSVTSTVFKGSVGPSVSD